MMSKDHPLAAEEGQFLPLRKLVGQPLYIPSRRSRLDSIRAWFEELGEEPTIAGDLSNHESNITLKEACLRLGFLDAERFDDLVRPENMV